MDSSQIDNFIKLVTPVVGLTVADVVSVAKIRFAPGRVNLFMTPQM